MSVRTGDILSDRYEVKRMLGQGGMSTVWLGQDPRLNRPVAIKIIHSFLQNHANFLERFQKEAAAIASLRHQNVIQVFDYNQHDDSHYMVLEYVEGNNLKQELAAQGQTGFLSSVESVLELMISLIDAVGYAHESGILHRDLKPDNVLLRPDGAPVLTDFGIIKLMADDSHTRTGTILGTAAYMAPEQIEGGSLTHQSDLYSLGVILFELITGHRPFVADSPIRLMMKQTNEPPPLLTSLIKDDAKKDLVMPLEPVISKILAKDPADRYQTAVEFSLVLKDIKESLSPNVFEEPDEPISSLHKIEISDPDDPVAAVTSEFEQASEPMIFVEPDHAKQNALSDLGRIEKQLAIDPLREDQVQQQMLLHARTGNFAGSLRSYTQLQRRFADELGIDPLPETLALRDRILSARLSPLHNLKPDSSQFVGRESELNNISARLTSADCRLLTLLGLGGMGKTRLSRAVIRKLASADWRYFLHGIWFVPLASINVEADPQALIYAIAQACNIPISGKESPEAQLFNWFSDRESLLVLDNFEHIIGEADWVADLLAEAPKLTVLVTSRQRLNVSQEYIFPLRGFSHSDLPPNASPREMIDDASRLFLLTSRKLQPNFRPDPSDLQNIREICTLVNSMPLGIELAASWTRMLSCQEIVVEIKKNIDFLASNLRRLPDRHRSMRAVFAYSWDLLNETEQTALKNLSLIRGPFTLETAQMIGQTDIDLITSLVDKSLIQSFTTKESEDTQSILAYSLHEITRHYAGEILSQSVNELEKAEVRYNKWFISLLNQQLEPMYGAAKFLAAENVHFSYNDMVHALQSSLSRFGWASLDLAKAIDTLGKYYRLNGFDRLGVDIFGKMLDTLPSAAPNAVRLILQIRLTDFYYHIADYTKANELGQQAILIAEEEQLKDAVGRANLLLSQIAMKTGNVEKGINLGKVALNIAKESEAPYGQALSHNILGINYHVSGQFAEAFFHYEESLKLFSTIGDEENMWSVKSNLALPTVMVGQYQQALDTFQHDLSVSRKWRNKHRLATILLNIAWVRSFMGEFEIADDEIDESLVYYRETGDSEGEATAFIVMGHIDAVQDDYVPARSHFLDALRIAHRIQAIPKLVESIAGLALFLYELDGETETAWKIAKYCQSKAHLGPMVFGRSQTVLDRIGNKVPAEKRPELLAIAETYELNQVAMALMHHQLDQL